MTIRVALETLSDPAIFAPYGTLIDAPDGHGQRRFYSDWLGGAGLSPVFHVNSVPALELPAPLARLERHPHAAQCFVPLDVARYVVTVAPSLADGSPDLSGLRSFLVPGTQGVIYARGVWHAGASVLDRSGAFAVLMWRGQADDDQFIDISPITLCLDEVRP